MTEPNEQQPNPNKLSFRRRVAEFAGGVALVAVAGSMLRVDPLSSESALLYFPGLVSMGGGTVLICRAVIGKIGPTNPNGGEDDNGGGWWPDDDPQPIPPLPDSGIPPEIDVDHLDFDVIPQQTSQTRELVEA